MNEFEKLDLAQITLDEQFPGLHMEARMSTTHPGYITCIINLGSNIYLGPGDSVSVMPDRILEMLKDLKKLIEVDIERLEDENDRY